MRLPQPKKRLVNPWWIDYEIEDEPEDTWPGFKVRPLNEVQRIECLSYWWTNPDGNRDIHPKGAYLTVEYALIETRNILVGEGPEEHPLSDWRSELPYYMVRSLAIMIINDNLMGVDDEKK